MVHVPELLAPAGSLDAVRAAVSNGADAVYLGVERFNARDEGAQLTLAELGQACAIAHGRGARVYLTMNTLLKPGELSDALMLLGECVDRGIDAAIVQDIGLITLAQRVYPSLELHGSTQVTVHDAAGARVLRALGVQRVVLARENTLDDIREIRSAVPELGLETFVHGALCISYSGQCYMSGLISERSANRGSCAQSCRKDYVLRDDDTGDELDRGYLISARDLAAGEHVGELAEIGIHTLKVEGRKKRPEYVATVTRSYRALLDRVRRGRDAAYTPAEQSDLVQIYSRGFTGGMFGGRGGRDYVTRDVPDNRGVELGVVVSSRRNEVVLEVSAPLAVGDGVGFEPPAGTPGRSIGFTVTHVRQLAARSRMLRIAIPSSERVPEGWRIMRTAQAALLERARASYAPRGDAGSAPKVTLDIRASGRDGQPLALHFATADDSIALESAVPLAPAKQRALDQATLTAQLGRLGETPYTLGRIDDRALGPGLFIPVSTLNDLRQHATAVLTDRAATRERARHESRDAAVTSAVAGVPMTPGESARRGSFDLTAVVWRLPDARAAAAAGATEVVLDPFLRHPAPTRAHVRQLHAELVEQGIAFRLRTPTIVRPEERRTFDRWLALGLSLVSGHLGLVAELGEAGTDVVADYAVNCFNAHTAARLFAMGARRIVLSVELTAEEVAQVVAPFTGSPFDVLVYGRPEGMTIEHCVLSAAFEREPTTCRDLCVQKHPNTSLTDPAGYTFPVATDSACRNRLLHSRPIEASEFVPRLWRAGIRGYQVLFNVPGDDVATVVRAYRQALDALAAGTSAPLAEIRSLVGADFTRGHFARAV